MTEFDIPFNSTPDRPLKSATPPVQTSAPRTEKPKKEKPQVSFDINAITSKLGGTVGLTAIVSLILIRTGWKGGSIAIPMVGSFVSLALYFYSSLSGKPQAQNLYRDFSFSTLLLFIILNFDL